MWLVVIAVLSAGATAPAAHGQAPFQPDRIAANGFGDARNSYVWSMAWFKGRLYVGTARSAMCVEGATIAFYLPLAGFYRAQPAPGRDLPAEHLSRPTCGPRSGATTRRRAAGTRVYRSPARREPAGAPAIASRATSATGAWPWSATGAAGRRSTSAR